MNKQITIFLGCVVRDGKVLMSLRDEVECPDAHMKWEFPGGKVDFDETPQEAVIRELYEETGVVAKVNKLLPFCETNYWTYDWGRQQTLCLAFLCDFIRQEEIPRDHHVADVKWFELEHVKDLAALPGTDELIEILLAEKHYLQ